MTSGYLRRFIETLDAAPTQRDGLADAVETLRSESASEFSRCLRGQCIDVVASLRGVRHPEWKIVPNDQLPFGGAVLRRCHAFLDAGQEGELSSALLAQVMFRTHAQSLSSLAVLRSTNFLPPPLRVRDIADLTRRVTAGVAQSYGLPVDPASLDEPEEASDGSRSDFESILTDSIARWASLPARIRGGDLLGSAALVSTALGRGADQRISHWLQAIGLNMIDFARVEATEHPSDEQIGGVPVTREAAAVWRTARWLSVLGGQALSTDRIILASLAVPSSHLATHLTGQFGLSVNLPLLYLRTALPPGLSLPEAQWLIPRGDAAVVPGPTHAAGDVCLRRARRLLGEARQQPGFDVLRRLEAFARHNTPTTDFPDRDQAFLTGDAAAVDRLLRATARAQPTPGASLDRLLDIARPAARNPEGGEYWSYDRYKTLAGPDLEAAYSARRDLAACQPGPLGLRTLAHIGPAPDRLGGLFPGSPVSAVDAVGVAHCLDAGVQPHPPLPRRDTVRLVIGGAHGRHVLGVVARDGHRHVEFELPEPRALRAWQAMRRPAREGRWGDVTPAMAEGAALIGLDRVASLLDDADVEFTVMRPFDGFLVDQLIRSVATPRSVIHRVFGARTGTWAGDYRLLRRAGGTPLVIDDPSVSLTAAQPEAVAIADILGATRIGGRGVRRSTVLRLLEAAKARPPLIHFTGHGLNGLVGPSGEIASGVVAASNEVVGIESIATACMPRVVVASTCDVGATPPTAGARAWSTAAIACGASYSLAPGLPVDDTSALVFTVLVARRWADGAHLEEAVASVCRLGRSPSELLDAWVNAAPDVPVQRMGTAWIRERSAVQISHCMSAFTLSTA
ncbi:CHAT domain-containing protein [Streptomyces sp. NPDC051014]|uniref:CHAT domain-containing protein n=1 Tax=Streptomyces sp. NPDC051014 TaxID=3155751 RepID=UPI0033D6858C